ncbi:MAG TPA: hypothetical protein VGK10_02395 [Prolixibacteraceae bacterium]|jgi:hypothetical protein
MNAGWIKLHRKARENFLYKTSKPLTRREAWEDMLMDVNTQDSFCLIGNEKIECKRGQSLVSLDHWAKRFNWDKSRVRRFFNLLKENGMILSENLRKTTRITISNYELYQGDRRTDDTQMTRKRHVNDMQMTPTKEDKKREEEKKSTVDRFEAFWDAYSKKTGREKCLDRFSELSDSEIEKILTHVPRYVESTPEVQYRKNPLTYINGKHWEDEIISPNTKQNQSNRTIDGKIKLSI